MALLALLLIVDAVAHELKTLFFQMVSGLGLQFSYETYSVLKPCKKIGFKTMVFIGIFEEAIKGLTRPSKAS